ncbi:MAG: aminoglycoside phosphotransferase family protein [Chitinophagaceae bacterium]|nr:aminoglycoside phosphotransferase family protein [Chitinophagaceae bacterium]
MAAQENGLQEVLRSFGIGGAEVHPFGTGLINSTWKVKTAEKNFILQKINTNVFKKPEDLGYNIRLIADYLAAHYPDYYFIAPLKTVSGEDLCHYEDSWYRLAPFAEGSHSFDVVSDADHAYEAAKQFGRFTRVLSGLDASQLRVTIPDFHNLELRFNQFTNAVAMGNKERIRQSADEIEALMSQKQIVERYKEIVADPQFRLRITHHDTKISNVLFDTGRKGMCVIDLDTVMPGYFISDVGDMMRTYLSPVSEEEKDFSKIVVRKDIFDAIVKGYSEEMEGELTDREQTAFLYAGEFMIYMQALRFLTDHLQDDVYYGAKYEGHNYVRAGNQITLLLRLQELAQSAN